MICIGTCTLTLASLLDVGAIPSKPYIDPQEDDDRVEARWMDIGSYVGVLCKACVVQARQVGWMRFGEYSFAARIISGSLTHTLEISQ